VTSEIVTSYLFLNTVHLD